MVLHFLCAPPSHHTRESFNRSNEAFMPLRKNLIGFCVWVRKRCTPALRVVRLICLRYLPQNERTKPNKAAAAAFH